MVCLGFEPAAAGWKAHRHQEKFCSTGLRTTKDCYKKCGVEVAKNHLEVRERERERERVAAAASTQSKQRGFLTREESKKGQKMVSKTRLKAVPTYKEFSATDLVKNSVTQLGWIVRSKFGRLQQ